MCGDWNTYSTKKQLLIAFSLVIIIVSGLFITTTTLFLFLSSRAVESTIKSNLLEQAQNNINQINVDSVNLFDSKLSKSAKTFLNVIAYSVEDTYRVDAPFGPMPYYYQWAPFMSPPLVYEQRYNSEISYSHGAINVAKRTPYEIPTFSAQINQTIQRTRVVEPTMKSVYFTNPEFISGYMGFESEGVFGEYPGATNGNYTQLITYDTRDDDWYQLGRENQRKTQYTGVYYDPWVKQIMITIVRSIHNTETGTYMGTAGADLLTDPLQASVSDAIYLEHGRVFLFESTTGYVIADSHRQEGQVSQLITYKQITGFLISDEAWQGMTTSDQIETDDYYIFSKYLKTADNLYLMSSFVLKEDILATMNPILNDIRAMEKRNGLIIGCVFGAMIPLTVLIVVYLVHVIVNPIQKIMTDSNQIVGNLGSNNIYEGVPIEEPDSNISEIKAMQSKYREFRMSQKAKQEENKNHLAPIANQYYVKPQGSRLSRQIEGPPGGVPGETYVVTIHDETSNGSSSSAPPYVPPPPYQR